MSNFEVKIYVEKCRDGIELPAYKNIGDAGMDIRAAEEVILKPGETKIVPTGLKFAIPEGYELQVRPRSGISLNTPIRLANSPGTIDSGYRGEFGVIISNSSTKDDSGRELTYDLETKGNVNGTYVIRKDDRIAQIVAAPVYEMKFEEIDDATKIGIDRQGGFGSTGICD
jgi:dUTP pyrophosphatase